MTQNLCPAMHAVMDGSVKHLQCSFQTIPLQQKVFRQVQKSKDFCKSSKIEMNIADVRIERVQELK